MFEVIELGGLKTVTAPSACNHVYVVDVSGSMYYDLPKIRQNLKNIIGVVAQPQDTFSVIYFSGRGQCGVVFENMLVSDSKTIDAMHKAIDRHLNVIGLTGFADPLDKAMTLSLDSTKLNNFIMMTDGYDNQSNRADVLKKVELLPTKFQSVSFIEYGYYADRDLIAKMAEAAGGTHVFADGYIKYETVIAEVVSAVSRVNNIEVKVNKAAKDCIFIHNGQIRTVPVVDGIASVPEDVTRVHSIVPKDVLSKQLSEDHLYLILHYAAKKDNSELVWNVLQMLGDVALVEKYTNAFTKQELSDFLEQVQAAVLDEGMRFLAGKDLSAVPKKNAPTVIELLETLAGSDSYLVMSSPDWSYKRIGRASEAQNELPRFVQSPLGNVSMRSLVFSSERPNVSISTTLNGTVELPQNDFGLSRVPSFVTRNYTIVKDGILNVEKLPVMFDSADAPKLEKFSHEVIEETGGKSYWVFNLRKIPVINRSMVEKVSLDEFATAHSALSVYKANLKVLGELIKEDGGSTAKIAGLVEKHGEEAAKWLSSIGVRDYGFSPVGTKSAEATDEYESIEVSTKIKGLSSLPAVKAVREKIEKKKALNVADTLISNALDAFSKLSKEQLEAEKDRLTKLKRGIETAIAKDVYSLVLGRGWFGEDEVATTIVDLGSIKSELSTEKVRKMVAI